MSNASTRAPRSQFGLRGQDGGAPSAGFKNLQGEALKREADNNKRTMMITLGALGVGSAGLYFLASSGGIPASTPRVFTSVSQCVAARVHASGVCETQWNEANRVHNLAAPAYATMQLCEAAHGNAKCVKPALPGDPERAAQYIPVMAGYFFGQTPQGTFKGVPLFSTLGDESGGYRVAEIKPKEPELVNERSQTAGNRSMLLAPAIAASAAAGAALAIRGANARPPGAVPSPAAANAAPSAVPAATMKPAVASRTARGGLGGAARSAGAGSGGG